MFENITAAPADPILGLADLFRADDRPGKINLGIGVYKDETGKTPVLTSVKKAEQYLLENETTKNYLGIDGIPEFGRCTQELLFGKGSAIVSDKRARTAQTPGGTGALRVAADFLAKNTSVKRVWVSNPSWPNHKSVFNSAGLEVREYAYYDAANHSLDFDGLLASLSEAQAGDVVLFHGCCHNPTGIDPTLEQWQHLAKLSVEKGCIEISRLHKRLGRTMIYVTHDQVEAMTLADKIVVLDAGRVAQVGKPLELYHYPADRFVAGFIGSPKMNFLPVKVTATAIEQVQVELPNRQQVWLPVDSANVQVGANMSLGIRPEHLLPSHIADVTLEGDVQVVEQLGHETQIHIQIPAIRQNLVYRQNDVVLVEEGATFAIGLPPERCHLFREDGTACRRLHKEPGV